MTFKSILNSYLLLSLIFSNLVVSQNTKQKIELLCQEAILQNDSESGFSKADSAYTISKSLNYKEGLLKSNFTKAILYYESYDIRSCIKKINEIESQILAIADPKDTAHLIYLKGACYAQSHLYENAKKQLNKSLFYAKRIKNKNDRHFRLSQIYFILSAVFNDQYSTTKIDGKSFDYLKEAYKEANLVSEKNSQRYGVISPATALGTYFTVIKKFDLARFYFNRAIKTGYAVKNKRSLAYFYSQVANMYYQIGEYSNAVTSYKEAIRISKLTRNPLVLKYSCKGLILVYEKLKDTNNENKYLKILASVTDSLQQNNRTSIEKVVVDVTEDIVSVQKLNKSRLQFFILFAIILSFTVACVIFAMVKKYRIEKSIRSNLKFLLGEKMDLLNSYSDKTDPDYDNKLEYIIKLAIMNDPAFIIKFNELFPEFRKKILQLAPTLRSNDLKFCSYLKLDFDTKDIAKYLGYSVRAVESKKYRLRKKFNISSVEDINAWVSNVT